MEERIQKILSRCGFGSRRACEELIILGRVTVNGNTAELGSKADPKKDVIRIDGSILQYTEPEKIYIMLNKPRFVLSDRDTSDPRRSVFSIVENSDGLFVVGRLDFESEGLILLTNDGELANKLSHPRYGKEKEYRVLVAKRPDEKQLKAWRHGVILEDGEKTGPAEVHVSGLSGKGAWLRVVMTEGRKRQIREIGKTIGLPIVRLIRVRIGTLEMGDLKSGEYKELNENQVKSLRALVSGKPRAEKQAAAYAKLGEQQKFRKPGEQKPLHKYSRADRKTENESSEKPRRSGGWKRQNSESNERYDRDKRSGRADSYPKTERKDRKPAKKKVM